MRKYILALSLFISTFAFSQTKLNYDIGILFDNQTPELSPLLAALQHEIKSVVGEDAIINFSEANTLVNNYNLEKATENYNQLLNNNTDIIIAFGVVNNEVISNLKDFKIFLLISFY